MGYNFNYVEYLIETPSKSFYTASEEELKKLGRDCDLHFEYTSSELGYTIDYIESGKLGSWYQDFYEGLQEMGFRGSATCAGEDGCIWKVRLTEQGVEEDGIDLNTHPTQSLYNQTVSALRVSAAQEALREGSTSDYSQCLGNLIMEKFENEPHILWCVIQFGYTQKVWSAGVSPEASADQRLDLQRPLQVVLMEVAKRALIENVLAGLPRDADKVFRDLRTHVEVGTTTIEEVVSAVREQDLVPGLTLTSLHLRLPELEGVQHTDV